MNIIGWIREGDKSACGGTVVEGLKTCTGRGVPYSFQGARVACRNNCVIAEGFARSTLANGRSRVIHGMKTSSGEWVGDTFAEQTGKRFLVKNSETDAPLANRKFIAVVVGVKQEGTTDNNGYAHIDAKDGDPIELHLIYEAPAGPLTYGGI